MTTQSKATEDRIARAIRAIEQRRAYEVTPASADAPWKDEIADFVIDCKPEYVLLAAYKGLRGLVEKMRSHNAVLVKALRQVQSTANAAFVESEAFVEFNDYEPADDGENKP